MGSVARVVKGTKWWRACGGAQIVDALNALRYFELIPKAVHNHSSLITLIEKAVFEGKTKVVFELVGIGTGTASMTKEGVVQWDHKVHVNTCPRK